MWTSKGRSGYGDSTIGGDQLEQEHSEGFTLGQIIEVLEQPLKFLVVEGDRSHLDQKYLNSMDTSEGE